MNRENKAPVVKDASSPTGETGESNQISPSRNEKQRELGTTPLKEHNSDYYRTHIMQKDQALHRLLAVPQTRELKAPPGQEGRGLKPACFASAAFSRAFALSMRKGVD